MTKKKPDLFEDVAPMLKKYLAGLEEKKPENPREKEDPGQHKQPHNLKNNSKNKNI